MTAAPSSWWLQGTIFQWETESDELSNLVRVRRQERSSVLSAGGRHGAGWELASVSWQLTMSSSVALMEGAFLTGSCDKGREKTFLILCGHVHSVQSTCMPTFH